MGGLLSSKIRWSRWGQVIFAVVLLFGIVRQPAPAQGQSPALQAVYPLVYPSGTLQIFNPNAGQILVTYQFYSQGAIVVTRSETINSLSTLQIDLASQGLSAGTAYSLTVLAGAVVETAVYSSLPAPASGDTLLAMRGAVPSSSADIALIDNTNGSSSTVTIFNPGDSDINVSVSFWDTAGTSILTTTISVLAKKAQTLLPPQPNFSGSLQLSSSDGVFCAVLLGQVGSNAFASPALQASQPYNSQKAAFLPRALYALREGLLTRSTQVLLFNPDDVPLTDYTVTYFITNSTSVTDSAAPAIPPKGLRVIELSSVSGLSAGKAYSVWIESSQAVAVGERTLTGGDWNAANAGYGTDSGTPIYLAGLYQSGLESSTLTVQNTSTVTQFVQLELYDLSGSQVINTTPAYLTPGSAERIPLGSKVGDFEGSAVLTPLGGGSIAAWVDRYPLNQYSFLPLTYGTCVSSSGISPHAITDSLYSFQHNMPQIRAEDAWEGCAFGSSLVTVAVLDTGVDLDHPDLVENVRLDGKNYINPYASPNDDNGHGSHVTGIIAASMNGVGVVGVAPQVKVLPVKVLDSQGYGTLANIAAAIRWAADRAQIINLSLGGANDSQTLRDAVDYAVNTKRRLVIVAAGNCGDSAYSRNGCTYQNQPMYPAQYPNVIAVGAVNWSNTRASFSNVNDYVDFVAPGYSIFSTFESGGYDWVSGSSQATPHVAGLAALLWSQNLQYTPEQIRSAMWNSAVDLGPSGVDSAYGKGLIDAYAALQIVGTSAALSSAPTGAAASAAVPADERSAPIRSGSVIVKFRDGPSAAAAQAAVETLPAVRASESLPALGVVELSVTPGQEWQVIDQLRLRADVLYAEPNYLFQAQ